LTLVLCESRCDVLIHMVASPAVTAGESMHGMRHARQTLVLPRLNPWCTDMLILAWVCECRGDLQPGICGIVQEKGVTPRGCCSRQFAPPEL
jgi:hypothetical protein